MLNFNLLNTNIILLAKKNFLIKLLDKISPFCYTIHITNITKKKRKNMFIKIDINSDIPIYIQIKNEIVGLIAKGELKEGDKLPPVRKLAADLGINLHTVNKAYNILKQEGFISFNKKRGTIVLGRNINKASESEKEKLKSILRMVVSEYYCKNFSREDIKEIVDQLYDELENKILV